VVWTVLRVVPLFVEASIFLAFPTTAIIAKLLSDLRFDFLAHKAPLKLCHMSVLLLLMRALTAHGLAEFYMGLVTLLAHVSRLLTLLTSFAFFVWFIAG
jgi:hypothetical protein